MTTGEEPKLAPPSEATGSSPVESASATIEGDCAGRLQRLVQIGDELGTKRVAEEARELAARLSEGRF